MTIKLFGTSSDLGRHRSIPAQADAEDTISVSPNCRPPHRPQAILRTFPTGAADVREMAWHKRRRRRHADFSHMAVVCCLLAWMSMAGSVFAQPAGEDPDSESPQDPLLRGRECATA